MPETQPETQEVVYRAGTNDQAEELAQDQAAEETAETERMGSLFSPEGIMMLSLAGIIDLIDFCIASLFLMDIIAILTIGFWTYLHSQRISATRGAATRLGKAAQGAKKAKWLRPLLVVVEFIPIVGMLPCWTLIVYYELKS